MHANIDKLLKTNIDIEHIRLLRRLTSNPLKSIDQYEIAHNLLLSITSTFLIGVSKNCEAIKLIKSDSLNIINKWNNEPINHQPKKTIKPLQFLISSIRQLIGIDR